MEDHKKKLEALRFKAYQLYIKREQELGIDDPATIRSLRDYIHYLKKTDCSSQMILYHTEELYERIQRIYPRNHPLVASTASKLAEAYELNHDYNSALVFRMTCYHLTKDQLGDRHTDTLKRYSEVGESYILLEKYQEALKIDQEVYTISKEVLGKENEDTIRYLDTLANVYHSIGDDKQAIEYGKEVYESTVNDPVHPVNYLMEYTIHLISYYISNKDIENGSIYAKEACELYYKNHNIDVDLIEKLKKCLIKLNINDQEI